MSAHPPFDPGTVEAIAKVLGEAGSEQTSVDISRRTACLMSLANPPSGGGLMRFF
jgi:hypothetical protein